MTDLFDLDKITSHIDAEDVVKSVLKDTSFDLKHEVEDKLPYTKRVTIDQIVPTEYQNKLMAIDFAMSQCYWLIGDIAYDLVNSVNREKAREIGRVVSTTDVFEAVGYFCHRTPRSIRYYYECARYFPKEVRQKYDVSFSVYAEARWVQNWELLLQTAEQNPTWAAERVRVEYYKLVGKEPPVNKKRELAEMKQEYIDVPSIEEGWGEREPNRFKAVLLSKLDHTVDDLREVLKKMDLPVEINTRIGAVLLEIQDIEIMIRRDI